MLCHITYMSRTNREQSSQAMATTVMKFKDQFKNIWTPPQKKNSKYIFAGLNFPLSADIALFKSVYLPICKCTCPKMLTFLPLQVFYLFKTDLRMGCSVTMLGKKLNNFFKMLWKCHVLRCNMVGFKAFYFAEILRCRGNINFFELKDTNRNNSF